MTDQSVFEPTTPSATPGTTPTSPDLTALADQLKGIKNEDGNPKYDTLPKALEGLANSQNYIPELQQKLDAVQAENSALKSSLAEAKTVDEVVSRLTQAQEVPDVQAPPVVQGLNETDVEKMILAVNQKQQLADVQTANEQTVSNELVAKFGDKAQEVITSKAAELGVTVEALKQQSRENPKLVLAAFNTTQTPTLTPTTPSASVGIDTPAVEGLQAPAKSMLAGASGKEQGDYMKLIQADVYKRFDITG